MENAGQNNYATGYYHLFGKNGYPIDYQKAFENFVCAAKEKHDYALFYIGYMYYQGLGVKQDINKAKTFFEQSYALGNVDACAYLGDLYYNGKYILKDINKAYDYFFAAAKKNHANSAFFAGQINMYVYKNYELAFNCFSVAIKNNTGFNAESHYCIGLMIINKKVSETGDNNAAPFLQKAAELNYIPAMDEYGQLLYRNNYTAEGLNWIKKAADSGYEPAKKRLKVLNGVGFIERFL